MPKLIQIILMFALSTATGCSSIKIESGTTTEEMADKNEIRAKQIRGEWAEALSKSGSDQNRFLMVRDHIDSVSSIILRYGFQIVDRWQQGNFGRGEEIEAEEMRQAVDAWVAEQKPILRAYEDNMEYGIRQVKLESRVGAFSDEELSLLDSLAEQYYDAYSVVFYPNHNVEIYEEELLEAQSRHQHILEQLRQFFIRY